MCKFTQCICHGDVMYDSAGINLCRKVCVTLRNVYVMVMSCMIPLVTYVHTSTERKRTSNINYDLMKTPSVTYGDHSGTVSSLLSRWTWLWQKMRALLHNMNAFSENTNMSESSTYLRLSSSGARWPSGRVLRFWI